MLNYMWSIKPGSNQWVSSRHCSSDHLSGWSRPNLCEKSLRF